jgi:hypothetical protein
MYLFFPRFGNGIALADEMRAARVKRTGTDAYLQGRRRAEWRAMDGEFPKTG